MKRFAALILTLAIFGVPTLALAADFNPDQEVAYQLWDRDPNTIG